MATPKKFKLHNRETGEVAFVGSSVTECQTYGLRKGIITKERSANFIHLSFGWWAIDRVVEG
jgi:hypothetical protein